MIYLDRKMPKDCFDCPCLQTFTRVPNGTTHTKYWIRLCAAQNRIIFQFMCKDKDVIGDIPNEWINFTKPTWCPWKE